MFITFLEIGLSMSIIIAIMLVLSKILDKKYKSKWKYYIWLLIAIRLIIPINYTLARINNNVPIIEIIFDENIDEKDNISKDFLMVSGADGKDFENYEKLEEGRNALKIKEIIIFTWILGFVCLLTFYISNYIIFKIRMKKYVNVVDCKTLVKVQEELKIKTNIKLIKCEVIETPMLVGFFKPIIYMPNIDYTEEEERIIFKHELMHFKRKDIWYKLILLIAKCIHWFNPFIYLMIKQANRDLEYSCDDLVINTLGLEERKKYSRIILKTMEG